MALGSFVVLFVLSFVLWLLLTWTFSPVNLTVGAGVVFIVSLLFKGVFTARLQAMMDLRRYFWFIVYVPLFFWECIKANLDMAYRVCHPNLPINPGIVKVKTKLRTDAALTALANSITLTPGTLSVDVDQEGGYLYVHWVAVRSTDLKKASEIIIGRFEPFVGKIFEPGVSGRHGREMAMGAGHE